MQRGHTSELELIGNKLACIMHRRANKVRAARGSQTQDDSGAERGSTVRQKQRWSPRVPISSRTRQLEMVRSCAG